MIYCRKQNSTNYPVTFFLSSDQDGRSPIIGATPTLKISKNGGSVVTASGAIAEIDATNLPGWYSWAGHATDRNTLGEIAGLVTATGADSVPIKVQIALADPFDDTLNIGGPVADKLLGRNLAGGSDGGRMVKDALRFNRNKVVIDGTTVTVYAEDDVTPAWTGTVTRTAGLDPLQTMDPA